MRACQNCAEPIATAAKKCYHCGAEQSPTLGGDGQFRFPEVSQVAEENENRDRAISRFAFMTVLVGAGAISCVSGVSMGSLLVAGSAFFVAVLLLYVAFQLAGVDVGF